MAHAGELVPLLDDPALHEFTGGAPLSRHPAARRSPGGNQMWGNWVARGAGLSTTADVRDGEKCWLRSRPVRQPGRLLRRVVSPIPAMMIASGAA